MKHISYSQVPVFNGEKSGLKYSKLGIKQHSSKIVRFLVSF